MPTGFDCLENNLNLQTQITSTWRIEHNTQDANQNGNRSPRTLEQTPMLPSRHACKWWKPLRASCKCLTALS
uniref:Uncharacterized protein n=1 Tax=Oryza brachyantha TaxID=4533 RepID=J3MYA3_ORYBR